MEWTDEGVVLTRRPHGEHAAIVDIFTRDHGRHAGIVRGGMGRRFGAVLQPGNGVRATWRARLEVHLGTFTVEPVHSRAFVMDDRLALAGVSAISALSHQVLPERVAQPRLWRRTIALLDGLEDEARAAPREGHARWGSAYLRWEMLLLQELGFGLDLGTCALTGATTDLAFVSPRTGRAVSRAAAGEWADRLLPLPEGLLGDAPLAPGALLQGLAITGHFLAREFADVTRGKGLPEARGRLISLLAAPPRRD